MLGPPSQARKGWGVIRLCRPGMWAAIRAAARFRRGRARSAAARRDAAAARSTMRAVQAFRVCREGTRRSVLRRVFYCAFSGAWRVPAAPATSPRRMLAAASQTLAAQAAAAPPPICRCVHEGAGCCRWRYRRRAGGRGLSAPLLAPRSALPPARAGSAPGPRSALAPARCRRRLDKATPSLSPRPVSIPRRIPECGSGHAWRPAGRPPLPAPRPRRRTCRCATGLSHA